MDIELDDLINEALDLNEYQLAELNVEVEIRAKGIPTLRLNKGKFSQVLVNLVRNALDAMRDQDRYRKLTIAASRSGRAGLVIEISDTGAGISDEVRTKLFQQGFTTKSTGNGIGLHFCSNTVQSMGGKIDVLSEGPETGAIFRILLPEAIFVRDAVATDGTNIQGKTEGHTVPPRRSIALMHR